VGSMQCLSGGKMGLACILIGRATLQLSQEWQQHGVQLWHCTAFKMNFLALKQPGLSGPQST
jgi:hypothetical protein